MTKVVNIYKESYDVYIGRAGRGRDGYFGNPSVKGSRCNICDGSHSEPFDTLECFETYFLYRIENDNEFRERVLALRGKTLGCFCKPKRCHGDIIVSWIENEDQSQLSTPAHSSSSSS